MEIVNVNGVWVSAYDEYFKQTLKQTNGTFQADTLYTALEYVQELEGFVEVGAHIGTWTRILARHFRWGMAFEPEPLNFECLNMNLQGYGRVLLYHAAATSPEILARGRTAPLYRGRDNSGMHRLGTEGGTDKIADVFLTTVDSCTTTPYEGARVTFMKIDAENHELEVLKGAENLLETQAPVIVMEEYPKNGAYPAQDFLKDRHGYEMVKRIKHDYIFVKRQRKK